MDSIQETAKVIIILIHSPHQAAISTSRVLPNSNLIFLERRNLTMSVLNL